MGRRKKGQLGGSASVHAQEVQERLTRARGFLDQARRATTCEDAVTFAASAMTNAARAAQSAVHADSNQLQLQAAGVAQEAGDVFVAARDLCTRTTYVPPASRPAPVVAPAEEPRRVGGEVPRGQRLEIDGIGGVRRRRR
jgi:hypothetical protein